MPYGSTQSNLALKGEVHMNDLMKYNAANINQLLERVHKNSIGMEDYFDKIFTMHESSSNYPPYNLVSVSNDQSRLELALAGFKKSEVFVYTESGKLYVEGKKEDKKEEINYVHKGVAQRSFTRSWTLAEDTEVRSVSFEDGLLSVTLGKVIPETHRRKDYL